MSALYERWKKHNEIQLRRNKIDSDKSNNEYSHRFPQEYKHTKSK